MRRIPFADDGIDHFQTQARAVFQAAAVLVGAEIAFLRHELVQKVAVRGVDLDHVETGLTGVTGGHTVFLEQARNFIGAQSTRRAAGSADQFAIGILDGRAVLVRFIGSRHWRLAVNLKTGVRHPADMPELHADQSAFGMHGCRTLLPAFGLRGIVKPWGIGITLTFRRNLGGFGNDQARTGTLAVVFGHQCGRNVTGLAGTHARQRRHQHAVFKAKRTDAQGIEQSDGHAILQEFDPVG